ncbi:MAG TPA: type II secretion system protein GspG [Nitrospirota bacterium]|jgi:general secretion pathway protein G|nr:type II secretion system protein GspG [Nitrospirota bacterium]
MRLHNQKGFTLIEVIVVAGIIAVLAGILVPLIFKEIDESKIARASADVRSISNAVIILRKDTGQWPVSSSCQSTVTLLTGAGNVPALAGGWNGATPLSFDLRLNTDDVPCWPNTWKGPYLAAVNADPWGNAYITNADAFVSGANPKPQVWILSAGPDGIVQTKVTDMVASGDDVGLRIQ